MPGTEKTRPPWAATVSCSKKPQAEPSDESDTGAPVVRQAPVPDSQFSVKTIDESHELGHTLPQAPQLSALPFTSCSQPLAALPSQSENPAAHVSDPQTPPVHIPVALSKAHEVPSGAGAV